MPLTFVFSLRLARADVELGGSRGFRGGTPGSTSQLRLPDRVPVRSLTSVPTQVAAMQIFSARPYTQGRRRRSPRSPANDQREDSPLFLPLLLRTHNTSPCGSPPFFCPRSHTGMLGWRFSGCTHRGILTSGKYPCQRSPC